MNILYINGNNILDHVETKGETKNQNIYYRHSNNDNDNNIFYVNDCGDFF